jgi:hypothetical protein
MVGLRDRVEYPATERGDLGSFVLGFGVNQIVGKVL